MADPLSISASIAGLVALADLVFRSGTKYAKSYRGAQKEVEGLLREIRDLSVVLHSLSLVAFDLEETEPPEKNVSLQKKTSLQPHHLHDCHQLLRRLETNLSRTGASMTSDSGMERLQARLKWPFTSTESKDMILEIQRYKQIIDIALASDTLAKLNLCLSRHSEIKDSLEGVQRITEKILDIQVKIALNAKRDKVLQDFGRVNPRQEYETNRSLRHGLTGLWLTQGSDFGHWYSTPGSRIWCSGIPGAGKSVLAAAIVQECLQRNADDVSMAVAYFFCTYRSELSQQPSSILSSLCMQLAMQNENAFETLQQYHDELYSSPHFSTEPTTDKLIEILGRLCDCFRQVHIVVDGLDECGGQAGSGVKCLAKLALSTGGKLISLALVSRNEFEIRQEVEDDFAHIEIEAQTADIQLYVASELSERIASKKLRLRDPSLKDLIMARLVDGAKGMFRWVACQIDHMCELPTDKARREALEKLPPTLFATYDRILMRIEGYSDSVKHLVKKALKLLFFNRPEIGLKGLCEAISLNENSNTLERDEIVDEEDLLQWCSSFVRAKTIPKRHRGLVTIEFAHFTVREYLGTLGTRYFDHASVKLKDYGVSLEESKELVTCSYIRCINMNNVERLPRVGNITPMIENLIRQRRCSELYCYAVVALRSHITRGTEPTSKAWGLLQELFQPCKTTSFCLWAIDYVFCCNNCEPDRDSFEQSPRNETIYAILRPEFSTLHLAAAFGLHDICKWLLEIGSDAELCSRFGTPLDCAVGGLGIFKEIGYFHNLRGQYAPSPARTQTVQLLIRATVSRKPHINTIYRSENVASFALTDASPFNQNLEVVMHLVKAGFDINLSTQAMKELQDQFRFNLQERLRNPGSSAEKELFSNFVEVLDSQETPNETVRFFHQEIQPFVHGTVPRCPLPELSNIPDEQVLGYILSLIKLNNTEGMDEFLSTSRCELVKSGGIDPSHQDFSALHLAVTYRSDSVLRRLLDFGLEAKAETRFGRTPVHLCGLKDSGRSLRTLLEYGGTTLDKDMFNKTVWHYAAEKNSLLVLEVLISSSEREAGLKTLSYSRKSPICAAVSQSNLPSVKYLLRYCEAHEYWKHKESLQRVLRDPIFGKVCKRLFARGIFTDTAYGLGILTESLQQAIEEDDVDHSCTALEMALEQPQFNNYVPSFLAKYIVEGGDFSHMQSSLLSIPPLTGNSEGLTILLRELAGMSQRQNMLKNIPFEEQRARVDILAAMINQPDKRRQYQTPLHVAAGKNDLRWTRELIEYGAYIDVYDSQHKTPLFIAVEKGYQDVAEFLLDHGAQLDVRSTANETIIEVAFANGNWKLANLLLRFKAASKRLTSYGESLLNRMTRTQTFSTEHNLTLFHSILNTGDDLYERDIYGLSAFHNLFLDPCFVYLRSLLETGPELQVYRHKGWADLFFVEGTERLVEITRSFRYVRHKLNRDEMLQLSDAANPGTHSLLCRAACWNSVEAIQNIVGLGIHRFEHRCDEHGNPLNAAISHRRFEAVKCLVRNGAPVPTELCLPRDTTINTVNLDYCKERR
ncbi:hypothetical protein HG530_013243 [Fusarium avenaceum]|nr:hypothetical protein HG530_013243 [Fusarium avenaceum]